MKDLNIWPQLSLLVTQKIKDIRLHLRWDEISLKGSYLNCMSTLRNLLYSSLKKMGWLCGRVDLWDHLKPIELIFRGYNWKMTMWWQSCLKSAELETFTLPYYSPPITKTGLMNTKDCHHGYKCPLNQCMIWVPTSTK